jgi:Sec-independent protein translocase protein TatA
MFDFSWAQIVVLCGASVYFVGRKDLPRVSRVAGEQLGRLVGLVQGARAKADKFAANSELKQLQDELRSGLRELDTVRTEMILSMQPQKRGMIGGSMIGRDPMSGLSQVTQESLVAATSNSTLSTSSLQSANLNAVEWKTQLAAASTETSTGESSTFKLASSLPPALHPSSLASEKHAISAVAEEVWEQRGMGFQSRAEQGAGLLNYNHATSGSSLLSDLVRQSLIFDQYDRMTQNHSDGVSQRMKQLEDKILAEKAAAKQTDGETLQSLNEREYKDSTTR